MSLPSDKIVSPNSCWLPIPSLNRRLTGTPFICFKTPMSPWKTAQLPKSTHFSTDDLQRLAGEHGRLRLVVNLNEVQNYRPQDLLDRDVEYKWIKSQGVGT